MDRATAHAVVDSQLRLLAALEVSPLLKQDPNLEQAYLYCLVVLEAIKEGVL